MRRAKGPNVLCVDMGNDAERDDEVGTLMGLAALRIGVCLALFLEDSVGGAVVAAGRTRDLLMYPEFLGDWISLSHWIPLSASITMGLVWIFRALLLGALLGYRTRFCLAGLCLTGLPLLASAQLLGPTVHNMHLLWFLLLLAVSPAGQMWSLDQYLRSRSAQGPSSHTAKTHRYLVNQGKQTLLFARLLLACVYFFPGAWKLGSSGWSWASAERLIPLFHGKWYQFNFLPSLRVDEYPLVLQLGGVSIMLLELVFPLLVLSRTGRWIAFVSGLTFHVLSAQFLGIRFVPLWLCYGILIDWPWVLSWLQDRSDPNRERISPRLGHFERWRSFRLPGMRPTVALVLGVVLLLGAVIQGARGKMQSWPFACYPTFHHPIAEALPDVLLVVQAVAVDDSALIHSSQAAVVVSGAERFPSPQQARHRSQAAWGRAWDLLGYYGTPPTQARLEAYAEEQLSRRSSYEQDVEITLYEVLRSTRPEQWDSEPPVVRDLGTVRHKAR